MPTVIARVESIWKPPGEYIDHVRLSLRQPIAGADLSIGSDVVPILTFRALYAAQAVVGDTYRVTVEPMGSDPAEGA
jgi:hypothetical protein